MQKVKKFQVNKEITSWLNNNKFPPLDNFFNNYIFVGGLKNIFEFKNPVWIKVTIKSIYIKFNEEIEKQTVKINELLSTLSEDKREMVIKYINNLKESPKFFNDVLKELLRSPSRKEICDDNFLEKIDRNVNLFAFSDVVYCRNNNIVRPGEKNDMLTLAIGYNYPKIKPDQRCIDHLEKLLNQWFGEKTGMVLDLLSDFIANKRKKCKIVLTGSGSNGKSSFLQLLKSTFGELVAGVNVYGDGNLMPFFDSGILFEDELCGEKKRIIEFRQRIEFILNDPKKNYFYVQIKNENFEIDPGAIHVRMDSVFQMDPKMENEYLLKKDILVEIKKSKETFMWMLLDRIN
jgi:hypothetical protein